MPEKKIVITKTESAYVMIELTLRFDDVGAPLIVLSSHSNTGITHTSTVDLEERGTKSSWNAPKPCIRKLSPSWPSSHSLPLPFLPSDPPFTGTQYTSPYHWQEPRHHRSMLHSGRWLAWSTENTTTTFLCVKHQIVLTLKFLYYSHLLLQGCDTTCQCPNAVHMHAGTLLCTKSPCLIALTDATTDPSPSGTEQVTTLNPAGQPFPHCSSYSAGYPTAPYTLCASILTSHDPPQPSIDFCLVETVEKYCTPQKLKLLF